MKSTALIIMAKEPKVGSTKTRLCPPLEPVEAANLYEALLWDTINLAAGIEGVDLAIAVTPPESIGYFKENAPPETILIPVACEDIGECLTRVLGELLNKGYQQVLALNSDGPTLPPDYIRSAIKHLDQHDLVLGPAEDGGYYLIAFKKIHADLFKDINWSTDQVLEQTLKKADQMDLSVQLLPPWYDVDTVADIDRLRDELETLPLQKLKHTRVLFDQWPG
ncbi:MAG: glycosyltransferase [Anaerolineae bacterium]|nr:glycosyltransferase [Anaerolineae bacterium]